MSLHLYTTSINSDTISDNGYDIYFIDASNNDVTLTLHTDYENKSYFIKRQSLGGGHVCTINTFNNGSTIDGASSLSLGDGEILKIIKFNGNWVTFL